MSTRRHSDVLIVLLLTGLAGPAGFTGCRRASGGLEPYIAFVANNQSNSVAAVDLGALRVIRSIPVPAGPTQVAVRPHSHEVYAVSASGKISVIGYPALKVVATLDVGPNARDLTFSADGSRLYVLDPRSGEVVFGDGEHGQIPRESGRVRLGGELAGMALTADGKLLLITDRANGRVVFLDVQSRHVLGAADAGKGPGAVVALPDHSKAFVADTAENRVTAVDLQARRILAHLELGARPSALLLKPDGGELFVVSGDSAMLTIIDTFHDEVEQNLPAGRGAVSGVFRHDSSVLYLANAGDGSVTALDVQNRVVLDSTRAGAEPRALALTPDEKYLVVTDAASASLAVLRAVTAAGSSSPGRSAMVTTFPVGARPIDVVVTDWPWPEK